MKGNWKHCLKDYRKLTSLFRLLLILVILVIVIFFSIFAIHYQENTIAQNYQLLASIPAKEIIYLQESRGEKWKDYLAIHQAFKGYSQQEETGLKIQLEKNIPFKRLNWSGINGKIKRSAERYRILLDKNPVFTPGRYQFPLQRSCYYTDTFGAEREGGKRTHQGTDLFDKKGTKIFSVCSGTVEKLGWNRLGGERVGIRGRDGNYYYYAHLDSINRELWIGKKISQGELLGTMGNTGDAITTPDHLHFGIELPDGQWVNPYSFLKVWEYHQFGSTNQT